MIFFLGTEFGAERINLINLFRKMDGMEGEGSAIFGTKAVGDPEEGGFLKRYYATRGRFGWRGLGD